MKKIYQYNEMLKVWRVLEQIKKFLDKIDDEEYEPGIKYLKRQIYHLKDELDILNLDEVTKKLRAKKREEAGVLNFVKVYLTDSEIFEASREDYEKKKKINALYNDLKKKVMESAIMNE